MYPIPISETLIEIKTCRFCGTNFPITDKDHEFYEKVSPIFNGKRYFIPIPSLCPDCRQQRRLSFRNERKLYKRKCDATGKDIISIYSPDKLFKIYHQDIWWSDSWDPLNYGKDFDFSMSFFEQFQELSENTPHLNVLQKFNENCEYTSSVGNSKNCYLASDTDFSEDCMYSSIIKKSRNVVDGLHIYMCENVYSSINCTDSYNIINCFECDTSQFLYGCSRLTGCSYCYESHNLVNRSYIIRNEQVSKEEWELFIKNASVPLLQDFGISRNCYIIDSENTV